nr:uncharacterized protein LOC113806040 [Penaeus vannamei]
MSGISTRYYQRIFAASSTMPLLLFPTAITTAKEHQHSASCPRRHQSVTSPARLPGDGAALPDKGRREVTPTVILGRTGVPVEVTHEVTGSSVDGVLSVSAGDGTTARFRVTTSDLAPDGVTEGPGRCQVSLEDEGVSDGTTGAPFTQSDPSGQDEALGGDPTAGVTSYTPMTSQESAPWLEGVTSSRHDLKCTLTRTHTAFTLQHTYLHPGRYDLLARFQDTHAPSYWEVVAEVVVKELLEITLGPAKVLALGAEGAAAHAHISLTPILDTRRPPTDHEDFTAQPATHLSPPATHLSPPTRAHEAFTPPGRTSGGSDAAGPLAPTPAPQPFLAGGPSPAHDPQLCPGGVLSWAWSFGDDTGPDTKTDSRRREEMETHEDARVMKEGEDERMAGIIKTEGRESGGGRDGRGRQGGLITGANGIDEDRGASGDAGAKASAAAREELKERENIEKAKAKGAPPEAEDDTTASTSTTATSSSSSSSNTHGPDTSSPAPSSTTVHHTYHKPGLYNFSAQVLCDGRPRWRKPVAGAFLVRCRSGAWKSAWPRGTSCCRSFPLACERNGRGTCP